MDRSKVLYPSDYPVLYWLLRLGSPRLRLFDFGGNIGNIYYSYSPLLKPPVEQIEWTVYDFPATLEQGRKIASARRERELQFTDSVQEASLSDLLLVSGALHYWEKSIAEFVDQFPQPPLHVLINRTPTHDTKHTYITVQHTDSFAFPCLVRNLDEIISGFTAKGYALIDRWPNLELSWRKPLFPDYAVHHYSGFYFRYAPNPAP
jgi:putative methyltransferase (TIGR04325 family)